MKLTQWSLVAVGLLASSLALANTQFNALSLVTNQAIAEKCDANPDLYIDINADLGADTMITGYSGDAGEHFDFPNTQIPGDARAFFTIPANSECLKSVGVTQMEAAITQIKTSTSDGVVNLNTCKISVDVNKPGHYDLTLVENNGEYSCR